MGLMLWGECEGFVCLFKKRDPMNDDVEMGMHQA